MRALSFRRNSAHRAVRGKIAVLAAVCCTLASAAPGVAEDARALQLLQSFWASQKSTLAGKLGGAADPGFVAVVPPDSAMWAPGNLLAVSEREGLTVLGSREAFFPASVVNILGDSRSDLAVIDDLVVGRDGVALTALPGILESLGLLRGHSSATENELTALFAREGAQRLRIAFPDVQIHRLGRLDVELYLPRAPAAVRQLLSAPETRIISSAVFLRTVQLRFDIPRPSPAFAQDLASILGTDLAWKGASAEWRSRGLYVAIQAARCPPPGQEEEGGGLQDATAEARETIGKILSPTPKGL
jgi:hypothetical protein